VIGLLLALLIGWSASLKRQSAPPAEEWLLLALVGWGAVSAVIANAAPLAAKEVLTGWLVAWWVWVAARRATPRARSMAVPIMVSAALADLRGLLARARGRAPTAVAEAWAARRAHPENPVYRQRYEQLLDQLQGTESVTDN
jgi:hypothetical protein